MLEGYRSAAEARQPYSVEYRVRRHDGAWLGSSTRVCPAGWKTAARRLCRLSHGRDGNSRDDGTAARFRGALPRVGRRASIRHRNASGRRHHCGL
jgi:hypothetical protein